MDSRFEYGLCQGHSFDLAKVHPDMSAGPSSGLQLSASTMGRKLKLGSQLSERH
jgi:hypothetical protein